jgi:hypothetical protein
MLSHAAQRGRRRNGIGADQASTVALEFALVAPILIMLFFAVYDTSDAMITYQEVFNAARTIAASTSDIAVQGSNSSTKLYYGQIQLEASAIFAQMPSLRNGFHNGIRSITISSVNFEAIPTTPACTPGVAPNECDYAAYVVWSVAYAGPPVTTDLAITPALRACATEAANAQGVETLQPSSALNQVGPTEGSSADLTTIRTAAITTPDQFAAAPDPIIIVDVHYQYTPVFNVFVKKALDFWANGYWPLRSVQASQLNANGSFTALSPDQQYTGLVSTGTNVNGTITSPYIITAADDYPSTATVTGTAPPAKDYCISNYYAEPQS